MAQSLAPTALNSGTKLFTGLASAGVAKGIQAFSILTPEKIQQYTNQSRTEIAKLFADCTAAPYNQALNTDAIIRQIICEIKRNQNLNKTNLLEPRMFETLSAIINAYSSDDNKYISMKKSVYDNEQKASAQAMYNYALTNAGLNVAFDSAKNVAIPANSVFKPPPNANQTPINLMESAAVAAGISLANVKTGMLLLKKINERINKKYIPNFNALITMLASLEKEKERAVNDVEIANINKQMDDVNELILKFCLALDVMQPEEITQIDGLASNFNEILKNYDLEKYDSVKFNKLKDEIDKIMQESSNMSNAFGQVNAALGRVNSIGRRTFGNLGKASNIFGSMFNNNKENVPNRRGGKKSRKMKKIKTQKQNRKTYRRR